MRASRPLLLVLAALAAACTRAPSGPASIGSPGDPGPLFAASAAAATAQVPASASGPGAGGTLQPVGTSGPGGPSSPVPTLAPQPPSARLASPDGSSTAGRLGSWTLPPRGSDAPWQPASSLTEVSVPAGTRLAVALVDRTEIASWQAALAPASDPAGTTLGGLGERESDTPGLASVTLDPVPAGSWVLMVHLGFATGGGAAYYWFITAT